MGLKRSWHGLWFRGCEWSLKPIKEMVVVGAQGEVEEGFFMLE